MQVYNATDSPVVVDSEGHTLAGREWGEADTDFEGTASALEAGVLLVPDESTQQAPPAGDSPPPRGGAGSGRDAWAAYAAGKVEVIEDMQRDDIVDALKAAGFPVGNEE